MFSNIIFCFKPTGHDPGFSRLKKKQFGIIPYSLVLSCPVDSTFHWLSVNGVSQRSRFSIHMFTMPKELPIYMHCLARICSHDEDCTTVNF